MRFFIVGTVIFNLDSDRCMSYSNAIPSLSVSFLPPKLTQCGSSLILFWTPCSTVSY